MNISGKMMNFTGIPVFAPNDITFANTQFYISYNAIDTDIYGSNTTAVVDNNMTKFLILNGCHVAAYQKIIDNGGNYADVVKYFKDHIDLKNKHSDDIDIDIKQVKKDIESAGIADMNFQMEDDYEIE